jgi:hypothetical protein
MIHYDLPPVNLVQSDKIAQAKPVCDKKGESQPPGCGRRAYVASVALRFHMMKQTETDPVLKGKYRDAIASLGEILALTSV